MKLLQELYKTHVKKKLVEDVNNPNLPQDEEDLWDYSNINQEHTSEKTSRNQVASSFKAVDKLHGWKPDTVNLDIGGGREFQNVETGEMVHKFTNALRQRKVRNIVYDPYTRTFEHNSAVAQEIRKNGADSVTVNNVLNVIKEPNIRLRVIKQAYSALKDGPEHYAYFKIFEGTGDGKGQPTADGWQTNMKTAQYVSEIHTVFPNVTIRASDKLIIAQK
jgi:hypothetical protein